MSCTECPLRVAAACPTRRGQLVRVRSLDEILGTLDANGTLEGLPFMPEMARYCGQTFKVYRSAAKTCVEALGVRRMSGSPTVFLEGVRCDGAAHDGCQRGCLIFWKEAWLAPVEEGDGPSEGPVEITPSDVTALPTTQRGRYFCQSTELASITDEDTRGKLRPFLQDLGRGEVTLPRFARIVWIVVTNKLRRLLGRAPRGQVSGTQLRPPKGDLDLQPGEWVEVRSRAEIEATLDATGKNRGLSFEPEMLEHCGRRYRVAFPVRRIINEQTAEMVRLTSTVALEGVVCEGLYAKNCPRSNPFYWREIWLRRV